MDVETREHNRKLDEMGSEESVSGFASVGGEGDDVAMRLVLLT